MDALFQQQLDFEQFEQNVGARVIAQHRSQLIAFTGEDDVVIPITPNMPAIVVGDWLLLDKDNHYVALLERQSSFARKAPGSKLEKQHIAANVNTAFVMMSLNNDFNLSRLERFFGIRE